MRTSLISCLVLWLGCQVPAALAQSVAQLPVNKAIECNASLPSRAELALLDGKVSLSGEPKDTLEMQANPAKPSAPEKAAIAKWATLRDGCFDLGVEWMDAIQAKPWFRGIMMETKDSADALLSALYRGDLTYGAFNVKHMALLSDVRRRVNDGAETARREEVSAKPPAVPAAVAAAPTGHELAADNYQCEMDAARAYPVLLQQRMISPGVQLPNPPRDLQTNCSSLGGQVNCHTAQVGVDTSIFNRPPSYVTEDVNMFRRRVALDSCMQAKGYRRN